MEEIRKSTVVFASVLKPVDDTRMFEKMALSLTQHQPYNIHVIGYPSSHLPKQENVFIHPLKPFKRISFRRLFAPAVILAMLWKLKPKILIINSHELLGAAVTIRLLLKCRLIYDVQENYFKNILYTDAFPFLLRPLLALYVRFKEISFSPFIDHFILAERGYEKELTFTGRNKTVLENKIVYPGKVTKSSHDAGLIRLLFTGTLAQSTGVLEAIELARALYRLDRRIRLHLTGYCAQPSFLQQIKTAIAPCEFIRLTGGDSLISHQEIIQQILNSDFGIISYPRNEATKNRMPTKLFEYLGLQLPILLTDYQPWVRYCAPYPAAVVVNFTNINAEAVYQQMTEMKFYSTQPANIFWEGETFRKLVTRINSA